MLIMAGQTLGVLEEGLIGFRTYITSYFIVFGIIFNSTVPINNLSLSPFLRNIKRIFFDISNMKKVGSGWQKA